MKSIIIKYSKYILTLLAVAAMAVGLLMPAQIKAADRYNKDAQNKIAERVSAIEPIMVIVLSVLIGIILIMVMLPLLGIMSAMG